MQKNCTYVVNPFSFTYLHIVPSYFQICDHDPVFGFSRDFKGNFGAIDKFDKS